MLVDAAKAANVKLLIWSGLPDVTKRSGGKYLSVVHFDAKAAITDYAKGSGVHFVNVQAGVYMQNQLGDVAPVKQPDGTFALFGGASPDGQAPLIDTNGDYGLFVRKAIEGGELPSGSEIYAYSELLTIKQLARTLSEGNAISFVYATGRLRLIHSLGTGKTIKYIQLNEEQTIQAASAAGIPSIVAKEIYESYAYASEFGCEFLALGATQ